MKKLVCLVMLFALGCPVLAVELDWAEFCPPRYLKLETSKKYFWAEYKYWVSRKIDFESRKNNCFLTQEKDACLVNLRAQELNKNNAYNMQQQEYSNAVLYSSIISAGAFSGSRR